MLIFFHCYILVHTYICKSIYFILCFFSFLILKGISNVMTGQIHNQKWFIIRQNLAGQELYANCRFCICDWILFINLLNKVQQESVDFINFSLIFWNNLILTHHFLASLIVTLE